MRNVIRAQFLLHPPVLERQQEREWMSEWVSARERKIAGNDNAIRVHKVSKIRMKTATTTTTFSVLVTKQKQQRRSRNNNIIGLCLHRRTNEHTTYYTTTTTTTYCSCQKPWMNGWSDMYNSPQSPTHNPHFTRPHRRSRRHVHGQQRQRGITRGGWWLAIVDIRIPQLHHNPLYRYVGTL